MSGRTIAFSVDGIPAPQGSKTAGRTTDGRSFVREDNPALMPWRNAVATAARHALAGDAPLTGPLLLEATFRFPRPKSHYGTGRNAGQLKPSAPRWCPTRPDLDKLVRAIGDAITGIIVLDDAQIVELEVVKVYGQPGLGVLVVELQPEGAR